MKKRAVLFDLDGTLLWTVGDLADATNHALAEFGYPGWSDAQIEQMIGRGVADLIARALPGGFDNPEHGAVLASFKRWYNGHAAVRTLPYPGVPELLEHLHGEGLRLGLVTNKYQAGAEGLMARFFPGLLDAVVGDDPSHARKPDPEGVALALSALGVGAEEAIYVGDTELDLETARNAGLDCVCVSWGYRGRAALEALGVPRIADTAEELEALLR